MVKPKVLVDYITGERHVIPNDNLERTIGRASDCQIRTLAESEYNRNYSNDKIKIARTVSRIHATVKHETDGTFYIWDNNSTHGTYLERDEENERIFRRKQIFPNEIIILGLGYKFNLESADIESEEKAEKRFRDEDTRRLSS